MPVIQMFPGRTVGGTALGEAVTSSSVSGGHGLAEVNRKLWLASPSCSTRDRGVQAHLTSKARSHRRALRVTASRPIPQRVRVETHWHGLTWRDQE